MKDEKRLAALLSSVIEERAWHMRRKTGVEEGSIFLNAHTSAASGMLLTADNSPRVDSDRVFRGRNEALHRLEMAHV